MGKPDVLSRRADHSSGQGGNDNLTLLSLELFQIHALSGTRLEGDERNILQDVRCSLCNDTQEESVVKAAGELRKDKGRGTVKSVEWSESEGLLMFRGKIYVCKDRELRHQRATSQYMCRWTCRPLEDPQNGISKLLAASDVVIHWSLHQDVQSVQ
jgi:hypothetical protein